MHNLTIQKQSCFNIPSSTTMNTITSYNIPQLDGAAATDAEPNHEQPQTEHLQCNACERNFETDADFRWHKESTIGKEDCHILRSMLPYHYEPPGVDLAEMNRQQNVRNTLQMIDEALNLLNK